MFLEWMRDPLKRCKHSPSPSIHISTEASLAPLLDFSTSWEYKEGATA
jgi:hypothetical protein